MVHATRRVSGSGDAFHVRLRPHDAELLIEHPPPNAELAAHRQRQDGHRRVPAIAVAFEAPSATRARGAFSVQLCTSAREPASMPAASAARSIVQNSARSRSRSAPCV